MNEPGSPLSTTASGSKASTYTQGLSGTIVTEACVTAPSRYPVPDCRDSATTFSKVPPTTYGDTSITIDDTPDGIVKVSGIYA